MRSLLVLIAALALCRAPAAAEYLTLDRMNASPELSGPGVRALQVSPDGTRVTFLRGRPGNQFQLDLWEYRLKDKTTHRLVDSALLAPNEQLSAEERARRERQASASFSGILSYSWSPDGKQLLAPTGAGLYLIDAARPDAPRKITSGGVIDAQISPKGRYISYVRQQNLYVMELASGVERQLTVDGKDTVHNAETEFVAQEEMAQSSGYYWAPDDNAIAYKRYDEAPVPLARRFEIYAGHTDVVEQRYPAAGDPNVRVELWTVSPATAARRQIDLGPEPDIYLIRADWSADGKLLAYQRQSRDLKRLDLVGVDAATLAQRTLVSETSATWVNVPVELHFLKQRPAFIWSSERDGHNHLYLYGLDGKLLHPLTEGAWGIDRLLAVDEQSGRVFFESNRDAVVEQQVYATALDGRSAASPQRITGKSGWHQAAFADNGTLFADTWSDPQTPPQVSIRNPDGALVDWLDRNTIDASHPYASFVAAHQPTDFGTLTARDGQTLYYKMVKPPAFDPARRYPVLVKVYGGPGVQAVARAWDDSTLMSQYLAQQGFIVFQLDNRGSARRERRFTDAIYGKMGKAEVEDQLAGLDWLARQTFVDPKRIGVFGRSYGGFMTLRLLAAASGKIAAGMAMSPVTDWALYDSYYTERYVGGTPRSAPQAYQDSGVFSHLDGLTAPLLLTHGMADDNVLFINSTRLIDALVKRGQRFELMTYPGEKHRFSAPASRRHHEQLLVDYFKRQLAADTAPATITAAAGSR